jgi:hypothetical protein
MSRFRPPRAGIALTLTALIVLCGVAIAPLLTGTLPESADGAIHLYRLPVLDHAFKDGSLWPRYPVATVFGYGSPLFNFYSPSSLYPMHLLHLLGMSYLNAWLAGMALYVLIAAGGAYLLGRTWGGGAVGVVTAAAYVYSPYFIYDFLWRGTTSETAALALLPWVLWAIKTQADHPTRRTFLAVILSLALFVTMHNITTVHGGVLIGLYALFVVMTSRDWKLAGMRVFGALAIGALLAAFFWFPAIRENPNVKIDAITAALPEIDVTRNLISAWSAFQLPYPADPSLQQPPFAVSLGWPQLLLGLLALLTLRFQPPRVRGLLILAAIGVALLVFMLTPASAPLWQAIPFIGYSQYPTRLLGPASLLLALLAGYGVHRVASRALRLDGKLLAVGVPVGLIILYTLPLGVRTYLPEYQPQNVVDALDFEVESGFVGSSSFGEYVPVWTAEIPDPTALRDLYGEHTYVPRLRPPEGVVIEQQDWHHTSGRLTVSAENEAVLAFDWLYLPYFQATIDGETVEVSPSEDEGRPQITVPAGTHDISIWLAPSRTQAISGVVSLTALAATIGILGLWPLLRGKPAVAYVERFEVVRESRRALIAAVIAGLLALGAKAAFDRIPNPLRQDRLAAGYGAIARNVTDTNFGREITLIGYDAPASPVPADSTADFTLYWTPRVAEITRDYITVFTLRTPDGLDVSRTNDDRPGGVETHHWRQGQYVRQTAHVDVLAGTPPGNYSVYVQLFDPEVARPLDIISPQNTPVGIEIPLGTVEVGRAAPPPPPDNPAPFGGYPRLSLDAGGLSLDYFYGLPRTASAGQAIDLAFLWNVRELGPKPDVVLEWRAADTENVYAETPVTIESTLPFDQWQVGDWWYTWQRIFVPPQLEGELVVVASAGGVTMFPQRITITAPEHTFELPDGVTRATAEWNNGISLAGYAEDNDGITLYWTTSELVTADLRRFAHVVGADGALIDVADGVPADWGRPVTGWIPGEFVADRVPLNVLSGQTLRLGFYDSRTNERVAVEDGGADYHDVIER